MRIALPLASLIAAAMVLGGGAALAQTFAPPADPAKLCERPPSPQGGVAACTQVINGGTAKGDALAGAYNMRAMWRARSGQLAEAVKDWDQAIRLKPDFAEAYYNRANAQDRIGKPELAIADYDKAIELQPFLPQAFNNRCWVRAEMNVDLEKALADCDQALRLKADNARALDTRGLVKLRLGRNEDAIADYDASLKLNPKSAASLYGRGLAKLKLGDGAGAQADIAAARQIDPKISLVFENIGVKP